MTRFGHECKKYFRRGCNLRVILFIALAVAYAGARPFALSAPAPDAAPKAAAPGSEVFVLNEDLTYEVSWMSIPLGAIRTVVTQMQGTGENRIVTTVAYMKSYSGVPFVDLYEIDKSTMDLAGITRAFHSREKADGKWKFTDYIFDQQRNRLVAKVSVADTETGGGTITTSIDTVSIDKNCVDGLSLLFFARVNARSPKQASVPTFLKGKQGMTQINFYRRATSVDIDAVDYPVDVVELDGNAGFSGILGMTGAFTGWFSNDNAQIPIKGKVKIFLGSITVELVKWNRPGWNPPPSRSSR